MNRPKTSAAFLLLLFAASWVSLGCRPLTYEESYVNEHKQPALIEILTGEGDGGGHGRILFLLAPGESESVGFTEHQHVHARTARDLKGRPLRIADGRVQGCEAAYGAEVWRGLAQLEVGQSEAEVRAILPSLSQLTACKVEGQLRAYADQLTLIFSKGTLAGWSLTGAVGAR